MSASAPVSGSPSALVGMRAFIALIERLPVTSAVICTAWLSVSRISVSSAWRIPVCATTTRFCREPSVPAV